jgi:hypothetical protein
MKFKVGDKVKIVSLKNSFIFVDTEIANCLNKTFTVCAATDRSVALEESAYVWNTKDLILINNDLEIE